MEHSFSSPSWLTIADGRRPPPTRVPFWKRGWFWWTITIVLTPFAVHGAYEPAALLTANNLSELTATASTARSNLGLGSLATVSSPVPVANGGTAATAAGATAANNIGALAESNNLSDVASTATAAKNLLSTAASGTPTKYLGVDAGSNIVTGTPGGGTSPSYTRYTTAASSYTMGATNQECVGFAQTTTFVATINLPASPAAGLVKCIADESNNFQTNPPTVKTTDSSTIITTTAVVGATGVVMNQTGMVFFFQFNGGSPGGWKVM